MSNVSMREQEVLNPISDKIKPIYVEELHNLIYLFNGKAPKCINDGEYPVYGSNGLIGFSQNYNFENAVILGRVGAYCGSVELCESKFWASDNTIVVKPKGDNDLKFLYYLLKVLPLRSYAGGAAQPLITHGILKGIKTNCTDKPRQQKIASILSAYDDLIENNRRRIALLEQSARLLYQEWFVRFRFPGHEHVRMVDGLPEGWATGTIIDFFNTSSGGTPSRKNPEYYTGEINWVKTQELQNNFIFHTDEKITEEAILKSSAKIFPEKTVLVAMYGATIGQLAILANPATSNQACCALIPKNENLHYIYAYLFLKENKQGLINLSQGSAQNNISQEIIKNYPMILPPENLLSVFFEYVSPNFEVMKNLQLQINRLIEARDILLPRLMNGEIGV